MENRFVTSESVTEGHPDKVCDQISDAVLDAFFEQDPNSRVACETAVSTDYILIMGEITSKAEVNIEEVARNVVREIGYTRDDEGFNADTCKIEIKVKKQSSDIALGVNHSLEEKRGEFNHQLGAGDQGMVFGYASDESEDFMPYAIHMAHKLSNRLTEVRKNGTLNYLRPDGKTQVTVGYDEEGKIVRIDTIVVSTQHAPSISQEELYIDIYEHVIKPIVPRNLVDSNTRYFINPTGRFVIGGPNGDSGLTGRKIIVDTYGGYAKHGGGAFSGKDYTKVDRSAAYAARYVAKNIVAAGLAKKCEVALSYAIGVANPVSFDVNTFSTGIAPDKVLAEKIQNLFDLRPAGIIKMLKMPEQKYYITAKNGHFGTNTRNCSWEQTDMAKELLAALKN